MSSTGIPALYISLALVSLICISMGPLIDEFNSLNIDLSEDPTLPYSYERGDTWNFLIAIYNFWPLWVFLAGIIGHILNAISPSGGTAN
jgi:hypothetical protein